MRFLLIFFSLLQYKLSYSAEIKLSSFDKIAAEEFLNLAENIPNRQQLLGAFENSIKLYKESFGVNIIKPKNYGSIRIGTFNVQSWKNFNGKDYNPEKTLQFITSLDVDVLAIQEFQKLDSNLFAKYLELMRVPKNGYVHSNDLALISRFPIEESRSLDIETDGCAMFTKIKLPDETLNIVNLHLSWKDETGEIRAFEIEKFSKGLKDYEVNIILGDFNTIYSDHLSSDLKSFIEKIDEDREESTYLTIPSSIKEYVEAGSIQEQSLQFSCWSMRRVDHIFFPYFLKKRVVSSQVVPTLVSDHFPLLLDIKINAPELILNGSSAQKHAELINFRDVEALKSEDYVNHLISEKLGIHKKHSYARIPSAKIISDFCSTNEEICRGFFEYKMSLTDVLQKMIVDYRDYLLKFNDTRLADLAFGPQEEDIDSFIIKKFESLGKTSLNIFSYGCGSGEFEERIKGKILSRGTIKDLSFHCYDKYQKIVSKEVIQVQDLDHLPELEFDLIMSRWCLHHVKIENRWHDLAKLGKLLKPDGISVFIEQGYIKNRSKINSDGLCYNLLAGVVDVVANAIYCPDWFLNNERTEDFILEFLDDMDLAILSSFVGGGHSGSLTVESLDGDGFIESILIFEKQGKS